MIFDKLVALTVLLGVGGLLLLLVSSQMHLRTWTPDESAGIQSGPWKCGLSSSRSSRSWPNAAEELAELDIKRARIIWDPWVPFPKPARSVTNRSQNCQKQAEKPELPDKDDSRKCRADSTLRKICQKPTSVLSNPASGTNPFLLLKTNRLAFRKSRCATHLLTGISSARLSISVHLAPSVSREVSSWPTDRL